jgi:flagellar biosynthesis protein FlhF
MKIKRYVAPDMRQAIQKVRATLGADAVILSNKRLPEGVELVAAIDFDENEVIRAAQEAMAQQQGSVSGDSEPPATAAPAMAEAQHPRRPLAGAGDMPARPARPSKTPITDAWKSHLQEAVAAQPARASRPQPASLSRESVLSSPPKAAPVARQETVSAPQSDRLIEEMRREISGLRRLMSQELSQLGWREMQQHRPVMRQVLRRLTAMDLAPDVNQRLLTVVSDLKDLDQAWKRAMSELAASIQVSREDWLDQGGVIALLGPSGVGKTTTLAKLAARFCLRHGSRQLALLTTDTYRIGAEEQLHSYGRILDVPVQTVCDGEQLRKALNTFSDRRLVLIDTAGMGTRDVRFGKQLGMLTEGNRPIHSLLTLSATSQGYALRAAVDAFRPVRPNGCIMTKLDEAGSLGAILSTLISAHIPLAYVTDGQKVPEDMHMAKPQSLVSQCIEMARRNPIGISEEMMAIKWASVREQMYA